MLKSRNKGNDQSLKVLHQSIGIPDESGLHHLNLTMTYSDSEKQDERNHAINAETDQRELKSAQYNPAFLSDIASKTGGRFFSIEQISDIPNAILWKSSSDNTQRKIHLWHHPLFYITLVMLVSIEWYQRRKHGHP